MATRKPTRSELDLLLQPALSALQPKGAQNKISLGTLIAEYSVDLDAVHQAMEPNSTRWDYFLWVRKQKKTSELYLEVHKVSEEELPKIRQKAAWLRTKISERGWPSTEGRPLFLAPTAGIPTAFFGPLSRKLALQKLVVVMKGDPLDQFM